MKQVEQLSLKEKLQKTKEHIFLIKKQLDTEQDVWSFNALKEECVKNNWDISGLQKAGLYKLFTEKATILLQQLLDDAEVMSSEIREEEAMKEGTVQEQLEEMKRKLQSVQDEARLSADRLKQRDAEILQLRAYYEQPGEFYGRDPRYSSAYSNTAMPNMSFGTFITPPGVRDQRSGPSYDMHSQRLDFSQRNAQNAQTAQYLPHNERSPSQNQQDPNTAQVRPNYSFSQRLREEDHSDLLSAGSNERGPLVNTMRVDNRRLDTKEVEEIIKNKPWLAGTSGKDIFKFLPAYRRYKQRLGARGRVVRIDDCVKPVPLDWFLTRFNLGYDEVGELERRLQKKAKGYERILRRKVKEELLDYRMEIKGSFASMMYQLIEDIEQKIAQVSFEEDEEKEICRMFLRKLPHWLMETSSDYMFYSQRLFSFPVIIKYLKQLMESPVNVTSLLKNSPGKPHEASSRRRNQYDNRESREKTQVGEKMHTGENKDGQKRGYKDYKDYGNRQRYNQNKRFDGFKKEAGKAHKTDDVEADSQVEELDRHSSSEVSEVSQEEDHSDEERRAAGRHLDVVYDSGVDYESTSEEETIHVRHTRKLRKPKRRKKKNLPRWKGFLGSQEVSNLTIDSGATHTVAGYHQFPVSLKDFTMVPSQLSAVRLSDNEEYKIRGKILVDLRLTCGKLEPVLLRNIEVHLVDFYDWSDFLLGEDVLTPLRVMPHQALMEHVGKSFDFTRKRESGVTRKVAVVRMVQSTDDLETESEGSLSVDSEEVVLPYPNISTLLGVYPVDWSDVSTWRFVHSTPEVNSLETGPLISVRVFKDEFPEEWKLYVRRLKRQEKKNKKKAISRATKKVRDRVRDRDRDRSPIDSMKNNIGSNGVMKTQEELLMEERLSNKFTVPHRSTDNCTCPDCTTDRELLTYLPPGYGDAAQEGLGYTSKEDIRTTIGQQLKEALTNNVITDIQSVELSSLFGEFLDVFGTKDSVTRISTLPAMRVRLKRNSNLTFEPYRDLSHVKLQALRSKIDDLLRIGMITALDDAEYAAPVFMVPKKKRGEYRMVVDLRQLNANTVPSPLILPEIQVQLSCLPSNIQFFCSLDMLSGFDLLATDERDRSLFVFSTVFGLYQMNGAPMGFHSTPVVYQNRLVKYILGCSGKNTVVNEQDDLADNEGTFCRPFHGSLLWIDDVLIYGTTFKGFCQVVRRIFTNMRFYNVRFNAHKCTLI